MDGSDFEFAAALKDATDVARSSSFALSRRAMAPIVGSLAGVLIAAAVSALGLRPLLLSAAAGAHALMHEQREATLRGDFQRDKVPMLRALGQPDHGMIPGLLQLQRPCDIDGRMAYHVTTFIEQGGGIVTILAFAKPVPGCAHGSWRMVGSVLAVR